LARRALENRTVYGKEVEEVKEVREGKQGEAAGMFDYPFALTKSRFLRSVAGAP
jgi:hypothetical protein